ncbi:hypothetical protein Ancab_003741 [Ancistrocladus abbreviatus]
MPSETSDRRVAKTQQMGNPLPPPPAEQEPLPCPRCDSTNTKFCYYNNYNFSQPRHFCKSCRRYWTHGGTLRDIPVGGGSRKNAKRSRTTIPTHITSFSSSNSSAATTASNAATCCPLDSIPATPLFVSLSGSAGGGPYGGDVSILKPGNVTVSCVPSTGSFTSLLNASGPAAGFLALGGFGLGIGPGIEDIGLGRGIWPFPEVGYLSSGGGISGTGGGGVAASAVGGNANGNTWQVDAGAENGFVGGGDCFSSWPELAISTPGNGLK